MILEQINSPTATWLEQRHAVLREALGWIRNVPRNAPDGIIELRGREMYANVHGYATLPAAECRWESHRHTIDVQYCLDGGEAIDWLPAGSLAPKNDYVQAKDTEFWIPAATRSTQLVMTPGTFVLFLAGELHRPKGHDGTHDSVRKLVVKIHAPLFAL
jgi:YhcH/YjgK/YiaL family protein